MPTSDSSIYTPLVSVIIPTHNVQSLIGETLESVCCQSYKNLEIIVIDDGSTDDTLDVVNRYIKTDNRITVYTQEHSNAGHARNYGLSKARGDYLLFFDSDDIMNSSMIELLVGRAQETYADIVACKIEVFNESGIDSSIDYGPRFVNLNAVYSPQELGEHLFDSMVGWAWDKLFNARFIRENKLEFQQLSSTNDAYFVYIALAKAAKIAFVDQVLVSHRTRCGSISVSRNTSPHNAYIAYKEIAHELNTQDSITPEMRHACQRWGAEHLRWNFSTLSGEAQEEAFNDYAHMLALVPDCEIGTLRDADAAAKKTLDNPNCCITRFIAEQAICVSNLENQVKSLESGMNGIHNSVAFRVGRAITKIPRMIRDARR